MNKGACGVVASGCVSRAVALTPTAQVYTGNKLWDLARSRGGESCQAPFVIIGYNI